MTYLEVMHAYFRGERLEAWLFIVPTGLALLALAVAALRAEHGGFAWGTAIPAVVFGLILAGTGLGVGLRTRAQVAALEQSYAESPAALVERELPRMRRVNANFRLTYYAFGALAAVGLVLHYAVAAEWARGLGAVLVLAGGLGLLIDGFAERRAEPYTAALEALSAASGR